jgi:hypothetical protein
MRRQHWARSISRIMLGATLVSGCGKLLNQPIETDAGGEDATSDAGADSVASDSATPPDGPCGTTVYDYCCAQGNLCEAPTWAAETSCTSNLVELGYLFFYTPCDGYLAAAHANGVSLYDADSGVFAGTLTYNQQSAPSCFMGPASLSVSLTCGAVWATGLSHPSGGGSAQCEGDAGQSSFCAYLFPDGG